MRKRARTVAIAAMMTQGCFADTALMDEPGDGTSDGDEAASGTDTGDGDGDGDGDDTGDGDGDDTDTGDGDGDDTDTGDGDGDDTDTGDDTGDGDGDGDGDGATICAFFEGWEAGFVDPVLHGWDTGGNGPWGISPWDGGLHGGLYAARSEELLPNQISWIRREITIPAGGATLDFWYWTSTGPGDGLEVWMDGNVEQSYTTATTEYVWTSLPMAEGTYDLEFRAMRDGVGADGVNDRVWLDDVDITCP